MTIENWARAFAEGACQTRAAGTWTAQAGADVGPEPLSCMVIVQHQQVAPVRTGGLERGGRSPERHG
jgi:hypothetical protein